MPPNIVFVFFDSKRYIKKDLYSSKLSNLQNPFQRLVRRMTRFCVTIPGLQVLPMIVTACDNLGYTVRMGPRGQVRIALIL